MRATFILICLGVYDCVKAKDNAPESLKITLAEVTRIIREQPKIITMHTEHMKGILSLFIDVCWPRVVWGEHHEQNCRNMVAFLTNAPATQD